MKKLLVVSMLLAGIAPDASANPALVSPIGSVSQGSGGPRDAMRLAVSGTHAYALWNGLEVFDLQNPAAPVLVTTLSGVAGYDIAVFGRYLYLASGVSLYVVDAVNPVAPVLVNTIPNVPVTRLVVAGNYIYAIGGNGTSSPWTLSVFDFSNATAPMLVASLSMPAQPTGIAVSGSYALVADQASGLIIVDVSNPAAPRLASSVSFAPTSNGPSLAYGVTVSGNYAYVSTHPYIDSVDFAGPAPGQLNVIDITLPACPKLVSQVATPQAPEDLVISGRYVYIVEQTIDYYFSDCEFLVVDVGNATAPQVAAYSPTGFAQGLAVAGPDVYIPEPDKLYVYQKLDGTQPPQVCSQ